LDAQGMIGDMPSMRVGSSQCILFSSSIFFSLFLSVVFTSGFRFGVKCLKAIVSYGFVQVLFGGGEAGRWWDWLYRDGGGEWYDLQVWNTQRI